MLKNKITLKITRKPGMRPGEEDDPLPILYQETEQRILDTEGVLSMNIYQTIFKDLKHF